MVKNSFGKDWPLADMQKCVGDGWGHLVERLYSLCEQHGVDVWQVKEKYGELRFYVGSAPNVVHDAIEKAEDASTKICDVCGESGRQISKHGWIVTRCEKHSPFDPRDN